MTINEVLERRQTTGLNERLRFTLLTTPWGSAPTDVVVSCMDFVDEVFTDNTALTYPVNTPTVLGDLITLSPFVPQAVGDINYVAVQFTANGSRYEIYFWVDVTSVVVPTLSPYGTSDAVAALASTWTDNGRWTADTQPTIAQVEAWLVQVSGMMNLALQAHGFDTPIIAIGAVEPIDMVVESVVADLCHAANSQGRFYTERMIEHGISPITVINRQINTWVEEFASGFSKLLVTRHSDTGVPTSFSFSPKRQD